MSEPMVKIPLFVFNQMMEERQTCKLRERKKANAAVAKYLRTLRSKIQREYGEIVEIVQIIDIDICDYEKGSEDA